MCSLYILQSVPRCVPKSFICCCSGRASCMLTSRCMLPWLFVAVLVETRACRPRDACYPGCARHLTPLYVPVSPWARSATCKPCPLVLVPDSTVHCSRPPARHLDLSSSDYAQGPWVGFICIQLSKLFQHSPGMPINTRCRACLDQLYTNYSKTSTRGLR